MAKANRALMSCIALFALCSLALGLADWHTCGLILNNQQHARSQQLQQLLSQLDYDNDLLNSQWLVTEPYLLGFAQGESVIISRAYWQQQLVALIIPVRTEHGYQGPVELLLSVDASGQLLEVAITQHQETPGLGDPHLPRFQRWLRQLIQQSPQPVDALSGATITSEAIAGAIAQGLAFYQQHRELLHE